MLLKFTNSNERSTFYNGKGKTAKVTSRIHRKTLRIATKPGKKTPGKKISFGKNQKSFQACKNFPPTTTTLCDNSNDSGLGFDESHHHHQTLALNINNNNNTSNVIHHRPLSTLRYNDAIATPCTVVTQSIQEGKMSTAVTGKKSKSVAKAQILSKVKQTLNPPTQAEDTCNSDDFSSFYQTSGADNKTSLGGMSPSDSFYQSSPEKRSSLSGSDGSSPSTSDSFSPNPATSSLENTEVLPSSSLNKQFAHVSREGIAQLQIITQPEQQHRARYQTEGSRGAVKDRSGNGFPVVKLNGYNKPTTLQVFIGNDIGRVSPHIFYQACKVSGKNSTPCSETKIEGTMVIEIELKPENDMTVICDCVGILKERNVDVEHRLGRNHTLAASVTRNKKKSTKCRMVFRAKVSDDEGIPEILQICSNTITCTQPPGVPEICKKSLDSCSVVGGKELFIIGKNFLKDTKVTFVQFDESRQPKKLWEETVQPDKEYLQQTHLICAVPSYPNGDSVQDPVHVQIYVTSSSKKSEAHNFVYMPLKKSRSTPQSPVSIDSTTVLFTSPEDSNSSTQQQHHQLQQQQQLVQDVLSISWNEPQVSSTDMMPPPLIMPRTSSFSTSLADTSLSVESPITLKTEFIDQTQTSTTNGESQQDVTTSSTTGLQTTVPVTVKELIYSDSSMVDVTRMQNPFATQETQALMTSSQVQDILDGLKMQSNGGSIDLTHIKSEQSPEQVSSPPTCMLPPPPPPQDINQVQQQQVVENLLNLIVQSTIASETSMVVPQSQHHHHLAQDIVLNSPSTVTTSQNIAATNQVANSSPNMILNSDISSTSMMCEPSMMTAQMVQDEINSLEASIESSSASEIMSNAVSDATAETQAVVKQIFAQAAAEMFSEGSAKSQSTINNFMLGTNILPAPEQQQLSDSQQMQMQQMLVQELNAATSMMQEVKEEKAIVQPPQTQCSLNNSTPTTASSTTITQPFSPTTQDLTAMSESDLISFINPSVFM